MHISQLPNETTINIFGYLGHPDHSECRKVCKMWYELIAPTYYREIHIAGNSSVFLEHISQNHFRREIVQQIVFNTKATSHPALSKEDFQSLIVRLPCLKSIKYAHQSEDSDYKLIRHYIQYLTDIPVDKLESLEEVHVPKSMSPEPIFYDGYLDLNHKLKKQIRRLTINTYICYSKQYSLRNTITEYLSNFKILTHLTWKKKREINLGDEKAVIISILEVCPNLKYLDLNCQPLSPIKLANTHRMGSSLSEDIVFYPNLMTFSILIDIVTSEFMYYMLKRLPNLKEFYINYEDGVYDIVHFNINNERKKEFYEMAKKIDKFIFLGTEFDVNIRYDEEE